MSTVNIKVSKTLALGSNPSGPAAPPRDALRLALLGLPDPGAGDALVLWARWSGRLPVTEEIAGSSPVSTAAAV